MPSWIERRVFYADAAVARITSKADRELYQLGALMECMGIAFTAWRVVERRERPDFVVAIDGTGHVGIELTEILEGVQGRDRALVGRLVAGQRSVIETILARYGGTGAIVDGDVWEVPGPGFDEPLMLNRLTQHMAEYGDALSQNGGRIEARFEFELGEIRSIMRDDNPRGVELFGSHLHVDALEHLRPRDPQRLVQAIADCVRDKADRAASYDRSNPIWLALRNPNQRMVAVPPLVREAAQRAAHSFERVILYNDRHGVIDVRPLHPRFLDLL